MKLGILEIRLHFIKSLNSLKKEKKLGCCVKMNVILWQASYLHLNQFHYVQCVVMQSKNSSLNTVIHFGGSNRTVTVALL